ncbi:hypothetical protein F5J12DRAFT_800525 [Pisolithus orientalis]|uniref:uncharacterized protein n=1 Tax=Pisolithus orientalis TaxID=936130 RepID=UPI0022253151|nr:uncharacterized protein F5J12DRAFT_800525 [Pisolithus orientalis]KAI6030453.1 hypothetical protein F5J12DRAFT_800525 [Pisolithus orientalis]
MPFGRLSRLSALAVVACLPSALGFQPGADYGDYKTTNLYNCSGSFHTSNVTVPNSADTLPQIQPFSASGWEHWDFFSHGTFPIILRWSQGDQSMSNTSPSVGKIDVLIWNVNGTNVQSTLAGPLTYKSGGVNEIMIGTNSFKWDSAAQWFNVTLRVNGYTLVLNTFSAMLDSFHPNVGYYDGLLSNVGDPAVYGSVPVPRGHSSGYLATPDLQNISLDALTVLQHTFSQQALPPYINKYSTAVAWGYSKSFYDTHIFYQIEEGNGTVHEAAYLGRAIPFPGSTDTFESTSVTYAVTDDTALYQLSVNPVMGMINASLPGCPATNNISYAFNLTTANSLGNFTDLGGGVTMYYALNGSTTAPFNGSAVTGFIAGVFQLYQAPAKQSS